MTQFGVFTNAGEKPIQTFNADYMTQDKEFVSFYKTDPNRGDEQVGAAHLDKNQYVRKLGSERGF